jgi:hypothetical protein
LEWWLELLYLYGFPAIATALGVALVIVWGVMPPTAKLLTKKKMGLGGSKGYVMTAYDDRLMQVEAMNVYPEGSLEKKKKHGSLTFYLAKPQDDTANTDGNRQNEERDRDMLPPYSLDGVLPVFLGHVSKAIATNPKILTALRAANRGVSKKSFKADAKLPFPVTVEGEDEPIQTFPVNVILPYDPVDIKKNFPSYWQQSGIDATKKRNQAIGFEKARREYRDYIWPLVIVGAVVIVGMVVTGLATGLLG